METSSGLPRARFIFRQPMRSRWLWILGIAATYFVIVAPLLTWMEFSDGIENLNIETSLEMRRGGPWLIPTLMNEPRVRKPAFLAWITASSIASQTVADMSSLDKETREAAWTRLAWQVRWPALLAGALTLGLASELGWTLLGARIGIFTALITGTSMIFIEHVRSATTDIQLALWVTCANACIARLIFNRQIWLGLVGGGIALGLAFLSKGPVAILMTVAPAVIFVLWRRTVRGGTELDSNLQKSNRLHIISAGVIGTAFMLVISLSWFIHVMIEYPSQAQVWWREVLRTDPLEKATSHWFDYLLAIPRFSPWVVFYLIGLWLALEAFWKVTRGRLTGEQRERAIRLVYVAMLIIVPVLIMSFFRDRKPRYLYPITIPVGMLAALAAWELVRAGRDRLAQTAINLHWIIVAVIAIGLPLVGTLGITTFVRMDGSPWYPKLFGIAATLVMSLLVVAFFVVSRQYRAMTVPATALVMILTLFLLIHGKRHGRSGDGASEMLPVARVLWEKHPQAIIYDMTNPSMKLIPPELAIYMNRPFKRIDEIANIPPSDHPQIYVARQRHNGAQVQPAPGWRELMRTPRDLDVWVVCIRE